METFNVLQVSRKNFSGMGVLSAQEAALFALWPKPSDTMTIHAKNVSLFFSQIWIMEGFRKTAWQRIWGFLTRKYRLVILNDNTFAESLSLKMSPWGLIIAFSALTIILVSLVISIVAFTPFREYIPGYGHVTDRKQIIRLSLQADSLERTLEARDVYLSSLMNVLNENVETRHDKPVKDTSGRYAKLRTTPSSADMEFRSQYEKEKVSIASGVARLRYSMMGELVFFAPVNGYVLHSFNPAEGHYGADIVTRQDELIRSTLDGTVIFEGFSAQDGNVIHIQHGSNLVSIYKHCSSLLRKTGDRVKSGEAIAVVGNSGERTNGPHLHFELWFNGQPVNPQEFVAF
jgi:murein DD-endopeptidase MepM/ murein hydrolase activator NlpD